jgi:hypothetical protein
MDTQGGDVFHTLLSYLTASIQSFPDPRRGTNRHYSIENITLSAFAVFFCQSPSFLAHQKLMQQIQGRNNARTVFGIQKLPTDNQIRNLLDPVDPALLQTAYRQTFSYLQAQGDMEAFRSFGNTLLVALDGTGYFQSDSIHCERCMVSQHKDGRTTYTHSALMPAVVKPGCSQVIALEPEFMVAQDGQEKQDCEREAAKRWIRRFAAHYSSLGITVLGDGLYAAQPTIQMVIEEEMDYIFVVKSTNHKYLYEELQALEKLGEIRELKRTKGTGRKRRHFLYRYVNAVPLNGGKSSVEVNWVELTMTDDSGKVTFHTAFVTNHVITEQNVEELVEAGRCRWKIENEDINTLKTKGYHFEHNFGHGKSICRRRCLRSTSWRFCFTRCWSCTISAMHCFVPCSPAAIPSISTLQPLLNTSASTASST